MNVTTKTVSTYCLDMTETQAQDLLNFVVKQDSLAAATNLAGPTPREQETLNDIRQALLTSGLVVTKKEPD